MTVAISNTNALSFSSFGDTGDSGPFSPRSILFGERYAELVYRESYYLCTQHDAKIYDFDGRVISGPRTVQPLISAEKSPTYIPLKMRRPATPVRLGRVITESFTNLLFGENRFPAIRVDGDDATQDFAQTLARVGRLPIMMIRARNFGGSAGTVGVSWSFQKGLPRFESHAARNLHVHWWEDRSMLIPGHVTEVYTYAKTEWDGKAFSKRYFWFRRDWTAEADIVFKEVPYDRNNDPQWVVDEERSVIHDDGEIHFEWIQNLPTDEIDGLPDCEGLYDQLDQLDILNSVIVRGAILNLDPTLKLKMDADELQRLGVRKGSDNALVVGKDGDASYLEMAGNSIVAGQGLVESLRKSILETAQCVVPDPNTIAAQGMSSVAIKAMFSTMLAKADLLREQYAQPIQRMLEKMVRSARRRMRDPVVEQFVDEFGAPVKGEDGQPIEQEIAHVLLLPQRVDTVTENDPRTGAPVERVVRRDRDPGDANEISLVWPPYFPPTFDDQVKMVGAMQVAAGGRPFLSVETATDLTATSFGIDPAEEKKRVASEAEAAAAGGLAMFPPGAGGEVDAMDVLPPGAVPRPPSPPAPGAGE